jgi:putative sigma-54 modulation protein
MDLTIRGHHTSIDPSLHETAEKKLSRLERFLTRIDSTVVEVEHEDTRSAKDRYTVRIALRAGHTVLRAEERGADATAALELAADSLAQQARRHKERTDDRHRSGVRKEYLEPAPEPVREQPPEGPDAAG